MPRQLSPCLKKTLGLLLHASIQHAALEEFEEAYQQKDTLWQANLWLMGQLAALFVHQGCQFFRSVGSLIRQALTTSWRRMQHDRLSMVVHVFGLSLGLAVFILAMGYYTLETRFDTFHTHTGRLVRVIYEQHFPNQVINSAVSPAPAGPLLADSFTEVEDFCRFSRLFGEVLLSVEDRRFYESGGAYADASLFKLFSFPLLKGDGDQALRHPTGMVLSASMALK
jgi:putative ABC transport system permease protein